MRRGILRRRFRIQWEASGESIWLLRGPLVLWALIREGCLMTFLAACEPFITTIATLLTVCWKSGIAKAFMSIIGKPTVTSCKSHGISNTNGRDASKTSSKRGLESHSNKPTYTESDNTKPEPDSSPTSIASAPTPPVSSSTSRREISHVPGPWKSTTTPIVFTKWPWNREISSTTRVPRRYTAGIHHSREDITQIFSRITDPSMIRCGTRRRTRRELRNR
mmetsp:Transcript_16324/g.34301  ORF Transcript_16324/g.34301 Transcript_16324/m.34301 type:complete len:221 (+) Transcript_16324:683-1345(+)